MTITVLPSDIVADY